MKKLYLILSIILFATYTFKILKDRGVKGGMKGKEKEEVLYTTNKKKKRKKKRKV